MTRWEPNAAERLARASMDLFTEKGFEQTTVTEIAERAGLTERTFFRYFADKREVLFAGSTEFKNTFLDALENAPSDLEPMDAVALALDAGAKLLDTRREFARERSTVVASHPELRERELIKMANLAAAMAESLQLRGVKKTAANLVAQSGTVVFHVSFERWITQTGNLKLSTIVKQSLKELRSVIHH